MTKRFGTSNDERKYTLLSVASACSERYLLFSRMNHSLTMESNSAFRMPALKKYPSERLCHASELCHYIACPNLIISASTCGVGMRATATQLIP